jgi:NAD(P)-dependent dehydrogenase (short-subunit alcohol dehydrogenase family)
VALELALERQIALVTGAGRGIGRIIALALAEAGADVAMAARGESELASVASEVVGLGRQALPIATDVSDSEQVERLITRTLDRFGTIDVLVNCAGQFQKRPVVPLPGQEMRPPLVPEPVTGRTTDEQWRAIFDVNVNGLFYCCRAVAPTMIENRRGVIVNVSSNSAIQAAPYVAAYNASKAAVNSITKVLALEWAAYNVRVNAIAPGEYHTSLTDFSWSDPREREKRLKRIPLHREGSLRQLGILAVYLASPVADYITGQIIYMDGGLTARS